MKITDHQRHVKLNFQWNGQRSKDVCMFCGSTLLEPHTGSTYCKNCLYFQEEPIFAYSPMLVSSRVFSLGDDSPYEVKVPEGTCRYCKNTELLKVSDDIVCSLCNNSQTTRNLTPIDQIQFQLSSGKLIIKLIDQDFYQCSVHDKKANRELSTMVENQTAKSHLEEQ